MKVLLVVGARPQFIKAAALVRAMQGRCDFQLVHTGQHYDDNLSALFFRELGLPEPALHLGVGSNGDRAAQLAAMLAGLESALTAARPDWVLVVGDTTSTLAGALAASLCDLRLAHLEAGLRSFNRRMPEEINRLVVDHLAHCLFCPSQTAVENLAREGISQGVHLVGDVMLDVLQFARQQAMQSSDALERFGLTPGRYLLATVHRAENTDDPRRLFGILDALQQARQPVILPLHPRTRQALAGQGWQAASASLRLIEPLGYLDLIRLAASARLILTDSGGMQKEAYWLGVPCLTLRQETEWVETVEAGWNLLVGADPQRILDAIHSFQPPSHRPPLYGDGRAAERVVDLLLAG